MPLRGLRARAFEAVPSYRTGESYMGTLIPSRKRIACAADAYEITEDIRDATQEHLLCLDLNVRHQVIGRRVIGIGSVSGVDCHPREVFRGAIAAGASGVILVHNHPSGDPTPSRQDRELTSRIREVGEVVGIPLLDHVVVSVNGYVSITIPEIRKAA